MRKIVFRGKRVKPVTLVSQWIYGNYVFKADNSLPGLSKHFIVVHDGFGVSQWIEVEPDTVGQYTGLKDKNGDRIFEGDIVVSANPRRLSNKPFEIKAKPITGGFGYWKLDKPEFVEVIGNIHDNGELIHEK